MNAPKNLVMVLALLLIAVFVSGCENTKASSLIEKEQKITAEKQMEQLHIDLRNIVKRTKGIGRFQMKEVSF
jgi:heat shock protein HslJ